MKTLRGILSICFMAASANANDAGTPAPLEATVQVLGPSPMRSSVDLRLRATLRNNGHQTWNMPVVPLSLAQLSVDVFDANGRRLLTVPPPVPRPGDERTEPLASGQTRTFEMGLHVFSPPLPAGTYRVVWGNRFGIRMRTPVQFTIVP